MIRAILKKEEKVQKLSKEHIRKIYIREARKLLKKIRVYDNRRTKSSYENMV